MRAYLFIFCFLTVSLYAVPEQVVLLRHAEKIGEKSPLLSPKGFDRAAALVHFFTESQAATQFKPCIAVYAPPTSQDYYSTRPIQTISAVANVWQVPFFVRYTISDVSPLVREIMREPSYQGKMVLICWEHKFIPAIAQAFGVVNPPSWHEDVFDRYWVINFANGKVSSFQNLPQRLMDGDSPT